MLMLIIGGSGSGKSAYGEACCVKLNAQKKYYIATMQPFGEESHRRIARHRQMREGKGFSTIECYTRLEEVDLEEKGTVLLECMSNLVANEMFSSEAEERTEEILEEIILNGLWKLREKAKHLVIVTNEVFSDGIDYDETTEAYRRCLAKINAGIAAKADTVVEVVCGIPLVKKSSDGDNALDD